jgi:acyl-CoA thioesterase
VADAALRARLDAAIDQLDDVQRKRLLDWAGTIDAAIEGARAPGSGVGPLVDLMHITMHASDDGTHAIYKLEVTPDLLNPHGLLHGGAIYTMIDTAMGGATMGTLPVGEICATIEIKVSYLAAVREGTLTCDTSVLKKGRNVVFLESRVADSTGKPVAMATGSFAIIRRSD